MNDFRKDKKGRIFMKHGKHEEEFFHCGLCANNKKLNKVCKDWPKLMRDVWQ